MKQPFCFPPLHDSFIAALSNLSSHFLDASLLYLKSVKNLLLSLSSLASLVPPGLALHWDSWCLCSWCPLFKYPSSGLLPMGFYLEVIELFKFTFFNCTGFIWLFSHSSEILNKDAPSYACSHSHLNQLLPASQLVSFSTL